MDNPLSFKVFNALAGFVAIEPQWAEVANQQACHFLQFPAWYRAELEGRGVTDNVYFVACYQQNTLVAVLPFERVVVKVARCNIPVLQLFYPNEMGVNDVFSSISLQPHLPLLSRFLWQQIPFFVFVKWQCVLTEGTAATLGLPIRTSHASKYIEFKNGADAFWAEHSKKFTKGFQKKMLKAESLGDLKLQVVNQIEELPAAFEAFLAIENSGWKGESGTSILKQPSKLKYYQSLLEHYGAAGLCQINILWLGQEPIAAQFGLRVASTLYLLKIGFCEAYSEISPGYLILAKLVAHHCENKGVTRISFVTGVDWIDRWHPGLLPVGVFYTYNGTWWGALAYKILQSKLVQKRLAK